MSEAMWKNVLTIHLLADKKHGLASSMDQSKR